MGGDTGCEGGTTSDSVGLCVGRTTGGNDGSGEISLPTITPVGTDEGAGEGDPTTSARVGLCVGRLTGANDGSREGSGVGSTTGD